MLSVRQSKRILSLLLVLMVLFTSLPMTSFASNIFDNIKESQKLQFSEEQMKVYETIKRSNRLSGLVGFEGEWDLENLGDEEISIIVEFTHNPVVLQQIEARLEGKSISNTKATKKIENDYEEFIREMDDLFGIKSGLFNTMSSNAKGYEITARYTKGMNGVAVKLPASKVKDIVNFNSVYATYPDRIIQLDPVREIGTTSSNSQIGMAETREFLDIGRIHQDGITGEGVTVGILDTGVDYYHPDLKDAFSDEYKGDDSDMRDNGKINGKYYGRNFVKYDSGYGIKDHDDYDPMETTYKELMEIWDKNGKGNPPEFDDSGSAFYTSHGTHVAGTIAAKGENTPVSALGMAPDATILAYRVLGPYGSGYSSWIVSALDATATDKCDIVNMSLGNSLNDPTYITSIVVNQLILQYDMIFVIAAGNSGPNPSTLGSPGTSSLAITVGNGTVDTVERTVNISALIVEDQNEEEVQEPEDLIENPEEPIENPEEPIENPEEPIENPEEPIENPEEPIENPEDPIENPEDPIENPEEPIENPEDPEENPEDPEENPEDPIENPEDPEENPEDPEENPEDPIENPEDPEENPEDPIENPEDPEENPEDPIENPEDPIENPEDPIENPEDPIENPEDPEENPEDPIENPEDPEEKQPKYTEEVEMSLLTHGIDDIYSSDDNTWYILPDLSELELVVLEDKENYNNLFINGISVGKGTEAEFENMKDEVKGKIVVVSRGQAFVTTSQIAKKYGAAAVIVVTNDGGAYYGFQSSGPIYVPLFLTKERGKVVDIIERALKDNDGKLIFTNYIEYVVEGGELNTSSSRGPVGKTMDIKPDIVAPGTNVLSTVPFYETFNGDRTNKDAEGAYEYSYLRYSGTSMSAPHVAGIAALLLQYSGKYNLGWGATEVKARIMNTADYMEGYSVHEVGSGYINPYKAMMADSHITVDYDNVYIRGENDTAKGKLSSLNFGIFELNLDKPQSKTLKININNNSNSSKTYNLRYIPNYIGFIDSGRSNIILDKAVWEAENIEISFSKDSVTVGPNDTAIIEVTLSTGANIKESSTGSIEGYVIIEEGSNQYRLPFAAAIGDMLKDKLFDVIFFNHPVFTTAGVELTEDFEILFDDSKVHFGGSISTDLYIQLSQPVNTIFIIIAENDIVNPDDTNKWIGEAGIALNTSKQPVGRLYYYTNVLGPSYIKYTEDSEEIDILPEGHYKAILYAVTSKGVKLSEPIDFLVDNTIPKLNINKEKDGVINYSGDDIQVSTITGNIYDEGLAYMQEKGIRYELIDSEANQAFNAIFALVEGSKEYIEGNIDSTTGDFSIELVGLNESGETKVKIYYLDSFSPSHFSQGVSFSEGFDPYGPSFYLGSSIAFKGLNKGVKEITLKYVEEEKEEVNKEELEKALNEIEKEIEEGILVEDNYVEESWKALIEAIEKAKIVLEKEDATQEEVDLALEELLEAKANLVLKPVDTVNKAELEAKVNEIENEIKQGKLQESKYTQASWKVLKEAIEKAKIVLEKEDATQEEVDLALEQLLRARKNLVQRSSDSDGGYYEPISSNTPKTKEPEIKEQQTKETETKEQEKKELEAKNIEFIDIPKGTWYEEAVYYVAERGIIEGKSENNFAPNDNITRAQFITLIGRLAEYMGVDISGYTTNFEDVQEGQWYTDYVAWGEANGIINGYNSQTYGVNDNITREQMASILSRFIRYMNIKLEKKETPSFMDKESISPWAYEYVEEIGAAELMVGSDGKFNPKKLTTRAEAAQLLMNLMKKYID